MASYACVRSRNTVLGRPKGCRADLRGTQPAEFHREVMFLKVALASIDLSVIVRVTNEVEKDSICFH